MTHDRQPLSFRHVSAELRLFCGEDSLAALAKELKRNGCTRAAIVCGRSIGGSDAMAVLRRTLGSLLAGECATAKTNSPVPAVEDTVRALLEMKADAVVAVGGGSAAVTARAASILLAEGRPAHELCTRRLPNGEFESPNLRATKLPQFVVPTTPSTAFVKAGSAVHDPQDGHRLALFDPKTRVRAIFLHPEFLRTAPPELVLSASLNTLSTVVEALVSPECDPMSEAMLAHSLRLVARHLAHVEPEDEGCRERLAIAAVLCGRGTEQSGGGLASVLAHAIGHRSSVANGLVNAIVLPHALRFNASAIERGAERIVDALRSGSTDQRTGHIEMLESLMTGLSIPRRLRDIGVAGQDLTDIAHAAMSDWFIRRSPRPVKSAADVLAVLQQAW